MGEPLVDEADDHGSLADRRGAALDRPGANVADGEDAGNARLEKASAPAAWPVSTKPSSSSATVPLSHSVQGDAPRKRKRNESGRRSPSRQRHRLELAVAAVELDDLAPAANRDAGAVEVVDQVVGHRLARSARRWRSVTSAPPRASQIAAWAAELPPPTTPTRVAPHRCASGGPAA